MFDFNLAWGCKENWGKILQVVENRLKINENFAERTLGWWESWRVFWSISWLPWVVAMFVSMQAVTLLQMSQFQGLVGLAGVLFPLLYFAGHILLVPRMAKKQYRHFRLSIVRGDGSGAPLTAQEWMPVAVRIAIPQVVLLGAAMVVGNLLALSGDASLLHGLSSLVRMLHLFGIGPLAVAFAVKGQYKQFRFRVE